jgi:hypothetical protein
MDNKERQPGDLILDLYIPGADDATRAQAHESLRRFAKALLRIAVRLTREELSDPDSPEQAEGAIISSAP